MQCPEESHETEVTGDSTLNPRFPKNLPEAAFFHSENMLWQSSASSVITIKDSTLTSHSSLNGHLIVCCVDLSWRFVG